MFEQLPKQVELVYDWTWDSYQPYFDDLLARELNAGTIEAWLQDWSTVSKVLHETYARLSVATTVDTSDELAQKRYFTFLEQIVEPGETANNLLERKWVDSGITPSGYEVTLRAMRHNIAQFREENLSLKTELNKLGNEYDAIVGKMTVEWEGEEKTLAQLDTVLLETNRQRREQAWRLSHERRIADRETLDALWVKMLGLRLTIAAQANVADFRAYQWVEYARHDYTPQDIETFLASIREVVVPAMMRLLEKRKQLLGLETLRPWDMLVDPLADEPLKPFQTADELAHGVATMFDRVDSTVGGYYRNMLNEGLLDLDNRKNKAPGGYCTDFPVVARPFIFMNAVGIHDNLQTMLHEVGHAFHAFETSPLNYHLQQYPIEFAEVASMSMELLAAPYLTKEEGGFYNEREAARALLEHLMGNIYFWCYMSVVVAFQNWVYLNPEDASQPDQCDAKWLELWNIYLPGVDWSGLEAFQATGWQRKLHIYQIPFYYSEYGLAQLGATLIWRNAQTDAPSAVLAYRKALALGNQVTLPELFETAGAKLGFDVETVSLAVELTERKINELFSLLEA